MDVVLLFGSNLDCVKIYELFSCSSLYSRKRRSGNNDKSLSFCIRMRVLEVFEIMYGKFQVFRTI